MARLKIKLKPAYVPKGKDRLKLVTAPSKPKKRSA